MCRRTTCVVTPTCAAFGAHDRQSGVVYHFRRCTSRITWDSRIDPRRTVLHNCDHDCMRASDDDGDSDFDGDCSQLFISLFVDLHASHSTSTLLYLLSPRTLHVVLRVAGVWIAKWLPTTNTKTTTMRVTRHWRHAGGREHWS